MALLKIIAFDPHNPGLAAAAQKLLAEARAKARPKLAAEAQEASAKPQE